MDVPEESTDANSIPSPSDDAGVGVDTESPTGGVDSAAVDFGSGDEVSVGTAVGSAVVVSFRIGDVAGAAAGWSVGPDDPHPPRTAGTLDTRTAMASETTSFLMSLHLYGLIFGVAGV